MMNCLPTYCKCEHIILGEFIEHYNEKFSTKLEYVSCPEKLDRKNPQPELILKDKSGSIAIERKVVEFPKDTIIRHTIFHELSHFIRSHIEDEFDDDLYLFEMKYFELPLRRKNLIEFAQSVVKDILDNKEEIKNSTCDDIFGANDNSWLFHKASELDKDYDTPEIGIGVIVNNIANFADLNSSLLNQFDVSIKNTLKRVRKKFTEYKDYNNILVLELFSSSLNIDNKLLAKRLELIKVPDEINQIWLTYNAEDSESIMHRLYSLIYKDSEFFKYRTIFSDSEEENERKWKEFAEKYPHLLKASV